MPSLIGPWLTIALLVEKQFTIKQVHIFNWSGKIKGSDQDVKDVSDDE